MKGLLMIISYNDIEEDPELMLEELEFEYCLPRWFWTNKEWAKYSYERIKVLSLKKELDACEALCKEYRKEEDGERVNC